MIWGGGRLVDAWPPNSDDDAFSRVQTSTVETLLIGGALDFATPPQVAAKELLPYLPNGHQVVLPGIGHSTSYWTEQPEAGTRLVNTFLDSGRADDSLYGLGGWFVGVLIVITTIAGASVGANLALIVCSTSDGTGRFLTASPRPTPKRRWRRAPRPVDEHTQRAGPAESQLLPHLLRPGSPRQVLRTFGFAGGGVLGGQGSRPELG